MAPDAVEWDGGEDGEGDVGRVDVDGYSHGVKADWLVPQRVLAEGPGRDGTPMCLVKWCDLAYDHATWENPTGAF